MKKTIIALVALSGLAMAASDNFEKLDLIYVSGNDYTLDMVFTTTNYSGASQYILKTYENVNFFCQEGRYIGIEKGDGDGIGGTGASNFYNISPYTVTAGETEGWFKDLGAANRLNGLTLNFVGDATANTTTISITKPTGDGAFTDAIVLNVKTLLDPSEIQLNTDRISAKSITFSSVPEPATATLSLLALAGLAARRRRH